MVNADVVECYATMVDAFGNTAGRPSAHRGADYRRKAGQTIVAYETCTVVDSDLYSKILGYSLVAKRHRDGKYIGWAHIRKGTRPSNGTVLNPGSSAGLVAGFGDDHGSAWSGPHIHTTEGTTANHIYSGQNSDPVPDISAARNGVAATGTVINLINYHWYKLTPEAMGALQNMMNALKIYGGVDGGTGPADNDFGEQSVKGMQELGKRWGFLPGDYNVDGIPHNTDQNAPSSYGFFLQKWTKDKVGYSGLEDGLPAGLTSQFLVTAANKVIAEVTAPPRVVVTPAPVPVITPPVIVPPVAPTLVPDLPGVPEGFVFLPDIGSSQGDFDFAEYASAGGRHVAIKFGGGNASDSPYIAPRYLDQLARARAQQQKLIHYWFNGNKNGLTPETSADYFADNIDLLPGDIVALDVEDETATKTVAWTPAEVVRYIKQLRTYFPGVNGLIYMSDSLADGGEWDEVVALGWELWSASWGSNLGDPGTPPTTDDWAAYTVWQYTSVETVAGNYSGNPKKYRDTDGNLAKVDTWDRLGWRIPVIEVTPVPIVVPIPSKHDAIFHEYLSDVARLSTEYAKAFAPM